MAPKSGGTQATGKGKRPSASAPTGKGPAGKGPVAGKGSVAAKAGRGGRPPVKPIKPGRSWGFIALLAAVAVFAVVVIGYGAYAVIQSKRPLADKITGLINYRKTDPKQLTRNHTTKPVSYPQSPPVGGNHSPVWQDCMGNVYTAQVPKENAVHSLEHGAVWVTYNPAKLKKTQVAALASKARGTSYTLMSPYPGLKSAVSLQAWGYQVFLTSPTDKRVDLFIKAFANKAGPEQGGQCTGGNLETGTRPVGVPNG